jgi:uncharacterized protein YbcC (UPF0753/DUF2309 family)
LSPEHDLLRALIHEACEPVANFWPMKRFVHHNPIHGLEHLPFDRAVREARHLLGGHGYLSLAEYRQFHRTGRITDASVERGLRRVGPAAAGWNEVTVGDRRIDPADVCRGHLLYGFAPLEPLLLNWTLGAGGGLDELQDDLPDAVKQRTRARADASGGRAAYLRELWAAALRAGARLPLHEPPTVAIDLPVDRTVGDWVEQLTGEPVVEPVNEQTTKWVAAFVDEGMAGWAMPARERGLYQAWRTLAPRDFSGRLLGIEEFDRKVRALPDQPEDAIPLLLRGLGVPEARWKEYLTRHLAQLPGWAGLIRWLGDNPDYPGQAGHPADAASYLSLRLFYESELAGLACRRAWGIAATVPALVLHCRNAEDQPAAAEPHASDPHTLAACTISWPLFRLAQHFELTPAELDGLSKGDVETLTGLLGTFPEDRHGLVWLEAYEDTYRQSLLQRVSSGRSVLAASHDRPRAQIALCIDVRSESFRRHIEAQGPIETFGYAGFFGVAMNHAAFDGDERFPLCPVLLTPRHAVDEIVRPERRDQLQQYATGTRWSGLLDHLFHDLKQHPATSFALVDVLGYFFAAGLAGKTLVPATYHSVAETIEGWFRQPVGTRVAVDAADPHNQRGSLGFTLAEQAGVVEGGLRAIGLIENLARLVVLCGHGSVTDNNPYFGALHCGACGGKHGDANARAFAEMANNPEVREQLRSRGIEIPADTWFLPAKHITTSDRVEIYDLEDVPEQFRDDVRVLAGDLERAGAAQALERCGRLPRASAIGSAERAYQHVATRTADWANTRPEWGLSGNAAFVIGRRELTRGVNLQGRAFLHSYHPGQDPDGAVLERIMTAPLIVGQWINMEHYFSSVDPWFWGSGSKVIHNVVSGVGVMLGSQSDLQTGLPLQTVNNGAVHHHEPMRLLTVIEAPAARISKVIEKHALLQQLLHNGWLNLVAVDPSTGAWQRYDAGGIWEPADAAPAGAVPA